MNSASGSVALAQQRFQQLSSQLRTASGRRGTAPDSAIRGARHVFDHGDWNQPSLPGTQNQGGQQCWSLI